MEDEVNETLYINNINEKIKKEDLRKSLYALFARFGPILEIRAMKTNRMRGQAFIIFKDTNSSTKALHSMQNFPFFGKPMRISYSKKKSKLVLEMHGVPTDSKSEESRKREKEEESRKLERLIKKQKTEESENELQNQQQQNHQQQDTSASESVENKASTEPKELLFVSQLPKETTELMLKMMFQQVKGLESVDFVASEGVAFVRYDRVENATEALNKFQGFKMAEGKFIKINYSK